MLAASAPNDSVAVDGDDAKRCPGELIVGFTSSATEWQEKRAVEKASGESSTTGSSRVDAALVTVDPDQTEDASERLLRNPAVDFVEPNYVLRAQPDPERPQLLATSGGCATSGTSTARPAPTSARPPPGT